MIVKLGWRNIWRNKRRSIITILAVTFAVMLSIAMRGVQLGTYEVNIRHVVKLFSGYAQIQAEGYQDNPSLQRTFLLSDSIGTLLQNQPSVIAWTPRVSGGGLVSFQETSVGTIILGLDPDRERAASTLHTKVTKGSFLTGSENNEIVVGETLLRNLKAEIGDTVVVLAQGFDGSLGNMKYRIIGTMKTGSPEFDGGAILMGLSTAQDLLALYGRISLVAILLDDLEAIPDVRESLNRSLAGTGVVALGWEEVMPDFAQSIQLDNVSGMLMIGILIIVVAFGITNTVLMSVTERFREFGIILAMGMPQRKLVVVVLLETVFIVLIGLVLGNLLAAGINYYILINPIEFGGDFEAIYQEYGFLPRIESTMKPTMFLNSSLAVLIISIVAAIYPLSKVLRLEPLKGIRYT
jgi:ABC-type lipoprotein release transport system permease subunit